MAKQRALTVLVPPEIAADSAVWAGVMTSLREAANKVMSRLLAETIAGPSVGKNGKPAGRR